jgi:hypothetical protein
MGSTVANLSQFQKYFEKANDWPSDGELLAVKRCCSLVARALSDFLNTDASQVQGWVLWRELAFAYKRLRRDERSGHARRLSQQQERAAAQSAAEHDAAQRTEVPLLSTQRQGSSEFQAIGELEGSDGDHAAAGQSEHALRRRGANPRPACSGV